MQGRHSYLVPVVALAVAVALAPVFARAEPKAPSEEQNADAAFAASFIGKNYDRDLDIEGWDDQGGGLIVAPIYIHEYQREDGTFLVLTSRQARQGVERLARQLRGGGRADRAAAAGRRGVHTRRFASSARPRGRKTRSGGPRCNGPGRSRSTPGKISSAKTKGVRCTNVSWGQ
jgi:hypothetical protein